MEASVNTECAVRLLSMCCAFFFFVILFSYSCRAMEYGRAEIWHTPFSPHTLHQTYIFYTLHIVERIPPENRKDDKNRAECWLRVCHTLSPLTLRDIVLPRPSFSYDCAILNMNYTVGWNSACSVKGSLSDAFGRLSSSPFPPPAPRLSHSELPLIETDTIDLPRWLSPIFSFHSFDYVRRMWGNAWEIHLMRQLDILFNCSIPSTYVVRHARD